MNVRDAINTLLVAPEFEALEERLRNRSVFHILGVEAREASHAAFLAWLLDPRESHGLGPGPLRRFMLLAAAGGSKESPGVMLDGTDVDGLDLDAVEVRAEFVIERKRRPDIVVFAAEGHLLLVVEYKVNANEGTDQTRDYAAWAAKQPVPGVGRPQVLPLQVFLCPDRDDDSAPTPPFVHLDYKSYCQWLVSLRPSNDRARFLVAEFLACLEQRPDAQPEDVEEAVRTLRTRYRLAIDALKQASRADRESIGAALGRHAVVLAQLGISAGRRDLGGSALVAEARQVAGEKLTGDKWAASGDKGSWRATLEASVEACEALREQGLLGSGYPFRIQAFFTRPKRGVARLALSIRGQLDVPGLDTPARRELRIAAAADLRGRLATGPLKGTLGSLATIAALRIKVPAGHSTTGDTPETALAARPNLEEAFGKLQAVEAYLEQWCLETLPQLLRAAAPPS
jgi:PD-(D/E)XK nuclease superfamily